MARRLTLRDLLRQEDAIRPIAEQRLSGFFLRFERTENLLLQLAYETSSYAVTTPCVDELKSVARRWFYSATLSFRASVLLMSSGYYLEAQNTERGLIELLAKIRYLTRHPERLEWFQSLATGKKSRIQWRQVFDEVFPGYWNEYQALAYSAHFGVGSNAYRMHRSETNENTLDTGVHYKEFWSSAFANQTDVFLLGYVRAHKALFSAEFDRFDDQLKSKCSEVDSELETAVEQHRSLFGPNEWHQATTSIVRN